MTMLFIGVVSYEGSRFAASQGPDGLGSRLASALSTRGFTTTLQVNTADIVPGADLLIDETLVQESLDAELDLMARWDDYLTGGRQGLRRRAGQSVRWARRQRQRLSPPGPAMVRRLLNIEASHLDLLHSGLAANADWVIVLEDDAQTTGLDDCADGLAGLLDTGESPPAFINISQSFSHRQLGIDHLLAPVPGRTWAGAARRAIVEAERPVTNTVCAIAYRSSFLRQLLPVWDAMPLTPVVPIDWKLNEALMAMHTRGDLGRGDCWFVDPAPIDQMSMS